MPGAAGDGLGDSPTSSTPECFFGGERKLSCPEESSFLPASVSTVSRESLRGFQHTKRVGSYLIGRKLGEGSFAKVREGLHVITGEKVAVKVIDKKKAKKDSYVTKNLRREGQIQQMIRHPNITQLLDILETENSYYLVMELCSGGNLMHKIYEKKRLEEHEVRKYIRQLILAVEHLHRAGVVHRDLKIENLLLDENNNIKLIDFGLSNCAGILGYSDPFSTQCGSPAYAAPELLARKKYGPKVDVWSIGVNMFAMLTGTLPFTVEPFSLRALYQKMVDKEINPLPTHLSPVSVNFLRSLLEPDPTKRPNIQQALANRWLNDNYPGKILNAVTYPNRIHLEDLSQSVILHMSEKLGYKHSDVINTVLSNRACHTLAVYFLLNRKLENYLVAIRKPDINDNVCHRNQLHKMNKNVYEDKKSKDSEKRVDVQRSQKKSEKSPPSHKQQTGQTQNAKVQVKERRGSKNGSAEKESSGSFLSPFHDNMGNKTGCVTSCSLEYLEIQHPIPRTPKITRSQDSDLHENVNPACRLKDNHLIVNVVRSFTSVDRDDQLDQVSPSHHYRILSSPVSFSPKHSSERALSPVFPTGSTTPVKVSVHLSQASFAYEDRSNPSSPEPMSLTPTSPMSPFSPMSPSSPFSPLSPSSPFSPASSNSPISPISPTSPSGNNNYGSHLGSPNCVRSRGRFPMMGIGQMLRKKSLVTSPKSEKTLEAKMPQLQHMNPAYFAFDTAEAVAGVC